MTWQATLKPYKHQITHLGTFDIVILPEIFFFCCENSGVKRGKNPDGTAQTYPTYPVMRAAPSKKNTHHIGVTLQSLMWP